MSTPPATNDLGLPADQVVCTIAETASILKVHERTARAMVKDGRLKAARHGRIIRIPVVAIRKFLGLTEDGGLASDCNCAEDKWDRPLCCGQGSRQRAMVTADRRHVPAALPTLPGLDGQLLRSQGFQFIRRDRLSPLLTEGDGRNRGVCPFE